MNIKDLRKKTGLTQTEFGNILGVGLQTIQKYEYGEREPTPTILKLINFVFADYIEEPKNLKFSSKTGNTYKKHVSVDNEKEMLVKENANLKQIIELQSKNISLLEDQIELYKNRLGDTDTKSAG